ncbi:MAG: alanine racemase [Candidatus Cloacimonadota bacterium]|nr:MAG: alanine racemase [Candidatus Cloacimonadota bacterium]
MRIESKIDRATKAIINLSHLEHNYNLVKNGSDNRSIMGIVKANGYGHGIEKISKTIIDLGIKYLGVAYLEEALFLRNIGITTPILVLGAINSKQIRDYIENDIDLTASSIDKALAIDSMAKICGKKAKVHIKIDTGMERIGVHWYNSEKFFKILSTLRNIEFKGLFSHLSSSDTDVKFTLDQISRFDESVKALNNLSIFPKYYHISNSYGLNYSFPQYINMVRPGINLYGYGTTGLKPVMNLETEISYFKVVEKGSSISYNQTYKTKERTRVVTLPIGYGDGYLRSLSNKAYVYIRGNKYPQVGNICMDQMMVDIGFNGTAYNGDKVLLMGSDGKNYIGADSLAELAGTISYEILCSLNNRVPRVYKN